MNGHERRWSYQTLREADEGETVTNLHEYVEIATGWNRWDAASGTWHGASAAEGPVDLQMPDGKRLVLQCIGLAVTEAD